jgi:uncharacterized phage-associated protein
MWAFRFNLTKTVQASAVILAARRRHAMNYMKLLKLMYICDRESIRETGRPITGDVVCAMKRGPVLSRTLDLIKGTDVHAGEWQAHIATDGYHAVLVKDPGRGLLSRCEVAKLNEVTSRYENNDEWDMVEITHKLPEWMKNDPGDSSKRIPLDDILDALGIPDRKAEIVSDARESSSIDRFFETHAK